MRDLVLPVGDQVAGSDPGTGCPWLAHGGGLGRLAGVQGIREYSADPFTAILACYRGNIIERACR